jgi:hypothetical protein
VHRVHHHTSGVVEDQVEHPRAAGEHRPRGLGRFQRHTEGAGKVVAGAQGHQAERAVGRQLAPVAQRRHRRVDRPVASRDHQHPVAELVERVLQVAGFGARDLPYVGRGPQDVQGLLDPLVAGPTGRLVRDHEQGTHVTSPRTHRCARGEGHGSDS